MNNAPTFKNPALANSVYGKMLFFPGLMAVVKTMMVANPSLTETEAWSMLHAFLQWFSLIPQISPETPMQMIDVVDPAWHAFILNTAMYRRFCNEFVGDYVDHDPLDASDSTIPKAQFASFTIKLLQKEFGDDLNPAWQGLYNALTCCKGCGCLSRSLETFVPNEALVAV